MYRRFALIAVVLLLAAASNAGASVGIFDFSRDVGDPLAIGVTVLVSDDRYIIYAGGSHGIWGNTDQFHYAYKEVSGDVRVSASVTWQCTGWEDWAMVGVMLRETLAADSAHYSSFTRKGEGDPWSIDGTWGDDHAGFHRREGTGMDTAATDWWGAKPATLAVQRVTSAGYQIVQSLVDQGEGAGWEVVGAAVVYLPDDMHAGVALTSHDDNCMVSAYANEVEYDYAPSLIGVTEIPGEAAGEACSDRPGFLIKTVKAPEGADLNADTRELAFEKAAWLIEHESLDGAAATEKGSRIEELVNLHDSGGGLNFGDDQTFPGIDPFEQPTTEPADGDDDDQFATEVAGCIDLTAGLHVIGGSSEDGLLIEIGGIEIGRTRIWEELGLFIFDVAQPGIYSFRALAFNQTGDSNLELYEWLTDGTMLLLNDTANGGSAVYVPEPATITLMGFAGLALLRRRRT